MISNRSRILPTQSRPQRAVLLVAVFALGGGVSATATSEANFGSESSSAMRIEEFSPSNWELMNDTAVPFTAETSVRKGDTALSLLRRLGIRDAHALKFISSHNLATRYLKSATKLVARTSRDGQLVALAAPDFKTNRALSIARDESGWSVDAQAVSMDNQVTVRSVSVGSLLSGNINFADLPSDIAIALPSILGSEMAAVRALKREDRIKVAYEVLSYQGSAYRRGRILAAEFVSDGAIRGAYWYSGTDEQSGYYTADGRSLKESFLRSPVAYLRITSGFMDREHPVLKKWILHKGIDFAAPVGTPVLATANGIVEFVGDRRGFGNFITLTHNKIISTAYGHLDSFTTGLKKGNVVRQGDVIGFVGQTGWATGPHLHYEFRVNGSHQNPMTASLAEPLSGEKPLPSALLASVQTLRATLNAGLMTKLASLD